MSRQKLTKDMIVAAQERGWTVAQTARQYSFHYSSIDEACQRFGIALPLANSYSTTHKARIMAQVDDTKVKTFSASPAAIEKALAEKARQKKLQLMFK